MADDIQMGNTPFIDTPFSLLSIETIFFSARQMFGATEQKLNEYTVQMAEFKKSKQLIKLNWKKKRL